MTAPAFYNDLDASLAEAWRLIEDGVRNRWAAFHTPTVATVDAEGAPRLRTVVLRQADRHAHWLQFHTDRRSHKLAELAASSRVAVHLYDPEVKIQLRARGHARVHGDGPDPVADRAWADTRSFSRVCYRIDPGPGTPLDRPDGYAEPEPEDPEVGREVFRVVRVHLAELEWLYLHAHGHRRARFAWDAHGALDACWLTP